ncbi:Hypothetical predicted protein [Mytilus galloprovincialis]|uniref:DZIP3-like HEPN domain-containing protein n=1 Tax=Mytilus galloprovincialis TaxID=29158 RepID=A0A8B6HCZ3_MYTGA|nr:Hypothetical predicted protein [Mytilus galloprovincialis]
METVPLDEDERYYMQLLTFTLGIGMEVLHIYFEQKILKEEEFYMFLEKNKHYLFHDFYSDVQCCKCLKNPSKRGCLNKSQFLKLFDINPLTEQDHFQTGRHDEIIKDCLCRIDAKTSNDVDCMDISLMYGIIQSCFLNNRKPFHGNPKFLETIKDTRNFLAHAPCQRISKSDFDSYLAKTEKAILGIARAVGSYVTKVYKRKIDAFKINDISLNKVKEIIESSTDEVKKNLQLLIDDQQKNVAMMKQVKDELLEQLIKHKDELSIDIGNLRFDITQYNMEMTTPSRKETFITQDRMSQRNTSCSSEVKVPEEGQNPKKCRVEWRLQTPDTWNLNEIKETLEKFSGVLRPWFEIEFVHVGSLVIKTLVPKKVLDNRDQMKKSIQAFLEKIVEVCHINTELTTIIKVVLVVSYESDTTVKEMEIEPVIFKQQEESNVCENCQQKDEIISALNEKIYGKYCNDGIPPLYSKPMSV